MACDKWIFLHTTVSLRFASTEERLATQRNLAQNAPKVVGGEGGGEGKWRAEPSFQGCLPSSQSGRECEACEASFKGKREGPVAGRFRRMGNELTSVSGTYVGAF